MGRVGLAGCRLQLHPFFCCFKWASLNLSWFAQSWKRLTDVHCCILYIYIYHIILCRHRFLKEIQGIILWYIIAINVLYFSWHRFAGNSFARAEEAEGEAEKVVDGFSDGDRAKMAESSEKHEFQAEVNRLMDIIINSVHWQAGLLARVDLQCSRCFGEGSLPQCAGWDLPGRH